MSILTTQTKVYRKRWTRYGPTYRNTHCGSGYCEEHFDKQYLTWEIRIFGFRIWKWTLDSEDVPVWASAQQACSGSTTWRSKFINYF